MNPHTLKLSALAATVIMLAAAVAPMAHAQANSAQASQAKPDHQAMLGQLGMFTQMFQFIGTYTDLVSNHSEAGVAAIFTAKDIIKEPREVASYYESLVPQTKNAVVKRALHMQLADIYKNLGERDKALSHLTAIITEDARGEAR